MKLLNSSFLLFFLFLNGVLFSQNRQIKFNLDEEGNHWIRLTALNQVWVRYTDSNPGTTIDGYHQNETFDIGLRRTRLSLFGPVSDRVFFYLQVGNNNLTYHGPRKQGLFIHDALAELKIAGGFLHAGAGLTGWSGLSRYASPSAGSILTLDAPLYQQATNDVNDQFLRKYSVYAKGKLNRIDYRIALSKPMMLSRSAAQITGISGHALFAPHPPKLQFQTYVMYQFFDQESNLTPYNTGTYLGKKRVMNLGAGLIHQPDAMWYSENNGVDTIHSDLLLYAVDFFLDLLMNADKQTALSVYASAGINDFGKNYLRNTGVMNPANGADLSSGSFNGPGNAFPMVGSGTVLYGQAGYLFKKDLLGKMGTLQPFVASQFAKFDRLDEPMIMYEAGFNWLLQGHDSKISVMYQNRPVFQSDSSGRMLESQRNGMIVLQVQVMF